MSEKLNISPPKIPLRFLKWFCDPDLLEDVEGDLSELFLTRYEENGKWARLLYIRDVLLLLRPGIIKNFEINKGLINTAMLKNYLKIALRNFNRYKGYTALNLLGLVVGIASSLLILLWVNDEVEMDKFHANGEKIYRLYRNMRQSNGTVETTWTIPKPAADLMAAEYPEVNDVVLLSWPMEVMLGQGKKVSKEEGRFASQEFLTMFTFPLLVGDKESALKEMTSIVISRTFAEKYFGEDWKESAVGESLKIDERYDFTVTGVFEDPGSNSSIDFEWIASADAFIAQNSWMNNWGNGSFGVFFTVDDAAKARAVEERIFNEIKDHTKENDLAGDETLIIHKFQDIYLYSNFVNGVVKGGRIDYVRIMTVVATFLLIVACINFMNLATARSGRRSKEIGLRKVMGARRNAITLQFYLEAMLMSVIAVLLSVAVVALLLPFFNQLVGKELILDFTQIRIWYFLLGLIITVGLLSGSYPALLMPTFNIIQSIKGSVKQGPFTAFFRRGLVIFQFGISTLLIIGTAVVHDQINYVLTKDLGLKKENVIAVRMEGDLAERLDTYKTELRKIPEVKEITAASGNPLAYARSTSSASWEGKDPAAGYEVNVILSDDEFISTMKMEMITGRDFSSQFEDSTNFIINEVAAELMGFDDPLNKDLSFWGIRGKIIGVVKNFHMQNLYEPIAPLIITCINPSSSDVALIRIDGSANEAILGIEKVTKELNPVFDFEYEFIDQAYKESYESELTVSTLANIFTVISFFISCLGLLGLSAYTAERRSTEIGVRKVHGASVQQIIFLLSKDYTRLMLFSFLIAIPFGYYYAQNWLNNFEFRTTVDLTVFVIAGIVTFLVGVLTVSTKSYQAASINPVHSLRDE